MNDNFDLPALIDHDTDLEQATAEISADEHVQLVQQVYSDGIAVGVKHVIVADPVPAGRVGDLQIHARFIGPKSPGLVARGCRANQVCGSAALLCRTADLS